MSSKSSFVFISYSRRDRDFSDRLSNDLQRAGFTVWRDTEELAPGTVNWERSIREAIKNSSSIVLVASPFALSSEYVQGELAIAKHLQRPIFPIWAQGNDWLDCVPLDMTKLQYVDGRNEKYSEGLLQLIESLQSLHDGTTRRVTIGLPDHETFELSLDLYPDFVTFLNKVYMFRLDSWYDAFTYGSDWVLGNVQTKQLALPWQWFNVPSHTTLHDYFPELDTYPISKFHIHPGSFWGVWDIKQFPVLGIALSTDALFQRIQVDDSLVEIVKLFRNNHLKIEQQENIQPKAYKYTLVFGMVGTIGQVAMRRLLPNIETSYRRIFLVES